MDQSQTSFFHLISIGTKMVGSGASEVVLDLATVALVDGASVFIYGHNFTRWAHSIYALTLRPTGGVALVSPAIFNVVALDSEEPIEDLLFPNVGSTSDVPSDIALSFNERIVASTDGSKMVKITAGGVGVAIPSRQKDRVHVLAPRSSVSVDSPTDLTYGSEVSVIVDEGALLDMAGHETGLRFRPPPTKMCICTQTQLHGADADPDEEGSDDEWLAKAKKCIRVRSQHDALVCAVAHGDLKKTIWSTSGAEASACRDVLDFAEYTRAIR